MKTYTDQEIESLLGQYGNVPGLKDGERILERAWQAASARQRPRLRPGRTVAVIAACAVMLTVAVFAQDVAELVREFYRFTIQQMQVAVVDEIPDAAGLGSRIIESGEIIHTSRLRDYQDGDMHAEAELLEFSSIEEMQQLVPYPLPLPDLGEGAEFVEGMMLRMGESYREGAYLRYQRPGAVGYEHFSVNYVGPDAYYNMVTVLEYQPVTLLGIEGIYYSVTYPDYDDIQATWYSVICNRLNIRISGEWTPEQAFALAEQIIEKALAIDWDAIEADLTAE